jgi:NRPS condensation-like uncharacterized protein
MKKVPISQVDALFAGGLYPIEFLFFYRERFDAKRLRKALKRLSSVYWPAFGTYADGVISANPYREENHYIEEAFDVEIDGAAGEEKAVETVSRFRVAGAGSLFQLKVLRLKNGAVLIPKLNHLVGDGYSYFYFLSLLAEIARPSGVPFKKTLAISSMKPHHRRTALKGFSFSGRSSAPSPESQEPRIITDEIPRQDVTAAVRASAEGGGVKISSNDVLTAAAVKKMAGRPGALPADDIEVTIPIDVRSRVKEYGRKFFGNGIWLHTFKLQRSDVESLPLRDLAVQIRSFMPTITNESYVRYLTGLEEAIARGDTDMLRPFAPERGCLVTNLSRLPADKLDFGSGAPDLVVPLTSERNSAGILSRKDAFLLKYGY